VVDVVEPRYREPHPPALATTRLEGEVDTIQAVQLDPTSRHVQLRPSVPASGTTVVAEMPHVGRRGLVRPPTVQTPLRIGRVQELRNRVPRVVQAEHNRAGTLSRKVPYLR